VRLVRYVPGRLLGETPTDESGVRKVGRMLGRLTSALSGFSHPAAERWLAWDLRHLDELVGLLPTVEGIDRRKVLSAELDALGAETLPALRETRVQVVHNDFHGGNLVVDPEAPDFVTGILDFGDVVRSHPAADLAIAMSYAGSYSAAAGDPWAPADALAAGYRETAELTDDEAALLRPLVLGRLVQRMLLGSWLAASRPENADYTGRNITSTWRQIESLRQSPATRRAPGK
jgi:Ser/Thr protein kinase RdoA (MazF antagonist)